MTHIELKLPENLDIVGMDYGFCESLSNPYLFVWFSVQPTKNQFLRKGYGSGVSPRSPSRCHPSNWIVIEDTNLGNDWYALHAITDDDIRKEIK